LVWRAWTLLAGVPVGALGAWALAGPSSSALGIGAALGALALFGAALWIARLRDDDPARGAHLAAASSAGLLALAPLGACLLGLGPGPGWWLAAVVLALGGALRRGALQHGPSGGARRQLRAAVASSALGAAAVTGVSGGLASLGAEELRFDEPRARAVYDIDADVVTRALPRCSPVPARVTVLREDGARPRVSRDGRHVWYDAAVDGARQVQRLERATGEVVCWTCGEPGNNLRPYPGGPAAGVVFETDRHRTPWDPTNTELHVVSARGDAPRAPSRRVTYGAGPDDHAIFAPSGATLVWSQRRDGGYHVVSAALRSAHGGLDLGREARMADGGAAWAAPLDWSPDGRSLVVVRGNPLRPLPALGIDFATGRVSALGGVAGAAAFNADGGWVVVTGARRARIAGLLPGQLGFLLAPLAAEIERRAPLYRTTQLRMGEPWAEGAALELGELADWGAPSGVSQVPDEPVLVLGQQQVANGAHRERLLEIRLDCAG
jgi:hypothetical protein